MTNQQLQDKYGKATEKFVCKTLRKFGYWVYNIPKKTSGQPCDIVAIKKNITYLVWLIDAKHIRNEEVSFTFNRIEPNQIAAMRYARDFSNIDACSLGFAIFFDRDKQLRWLPFEIYEKLVKDEVKSVNMNDLRLLSEVLEDADRLQNY